MTGVALASGTPRPGPLRVAMLIQGYYPVVGGAERQLATLAPLLRARGLDVQVITRRSRGLEPFEIVEGVPVHRLPAAGPKVIRSFAYTAAALALLRRLRPDVIHAHDLYSPATTALAARQLFKVPVVVKIPRGGHLGDIARLGGRRFGCARLAWLRTRVDRFVVISGEIDGELEALGVPPERRIPIPNGVDSGRFAPPTADEKRSLRRRLELPEGPIVIYTGRLAREKGLRGLVAIWPEVRMRIPGALLLILGSGDERATLERSAGEGVRLTGPLLDVVPYLQAADLFVLPSSAEGLSNSLLEAMSTGLACVATEVGGAPDLIEHGASGWLVPPGEKEPLKRAILTLLRAPETRAELGCQARRRIESHYSAAAVAARFPELYRQIVPASRWGPEPSFA